MAFRPGCRTQKAWPEAALGLIFWFINLFFGRTIDLENVRKLVSGFSHILRLILKRSNALLDLSFGMQNAKGFARRALGRAKNRPRREFKWSLAFANSSGPHMTNFGEAFNHLESIWAARRTLLGVPNFDVWPRGEPYVKIWQGF